MCLSIAELQAHVTPASFRYFTGVYIHAAAALPIAREAAGRRDGLGTLRHPLAVEPKVYRERRVEARLRAEYEAATYKPLVRCIVCNLEFRGACAPQQSARAAATCICALQTAARDARGRSLAYRR